MEVKIPEALLSYSLIDPAYSTNIGDEWFELSIPISEFRDHGDFSEENAINTFAILGAFGDGGYIYLTDVYSAVSP